MESAVKVVIAIVVIAIVVLALLIFIVMKIIGNTADKENKKNIKYIKCVQNCGEVNNQEKCRNLCPDLNNPTPECIKCVSDSNESRDSCINNCKHSN
jgi:hypothetical protein